MQALLNGAGLRLVGKWSQLNTPHRAVLHDPAWHRELLAQTLLILLRPRLVAHCAHLDDNVTAGAVQTAGVVNAIWKSYTGVYFLGYGIAVAILFFVYPLTKQKTAEMLTELKARRAAKESK